MEAAVSSDIARLQRDHDLRGRTAAIPADAVLERSARLSKDHLKHAHIRDLTGQRTTWTCGLTFWPPALGTLPVSLRANGDLLKNFRLIWVNQPPAQKFSAFLHPQISGFFRAVPSRQEGRIARRHERWDGMRWTRGRQARSVFAGRLSVSEHGAQDDRRFTRTAKPCGPDTRGWCQAAGGEFDPTGSTEPSSRQ